MKCTTSEKQSASREKHVIQKTIRNMRLAREEDSTREKPPNAHWVKRTFLVKSKSHLARNRVRFIRNKKRHVSNKTLQAKFKTRPVSNHRCLACTKTRYARDETGLQKAGLRFARNKREDEFGIIQYAPREKQDALFYPAQSSIVNRCSGNKPALLGSGLIPPHTSKKNLTLSFKFESHSAFFSLARALGDSRPWWSGGESGGDESHKILNVKELSYPVLVFPSPISPRFFSFFPFLFLSLFFFFFFPETSIILSISEWLRASN